MNVNSKHRAAGRFASLGSRTRFGLKATTITATAAALLIPTLASATTASGASTNMVGHVDSVVTSTEQIEVSGWAANTLNPGHSVNIEITMGGAIGSPAVFGDAQTTAHNPRPDVARAFPDLGPNHGFDLRLVLAKVGSYPICVYSYPMGSSAYHGLGCFQVSVPADRKPIGNLEHALGGTSQVRLAGWAADPDTPTAPLRVDIYLGGLPYQAYKSLSVTANGSRPDVARALPAYGSMHGFDVTVAARAGTYPVCVYAINTFGYGGPTLLGCKSVTVLTPAAG